MRKIFSHQKLFLIVFAVIFFVILLFSTIKNAPLAYAADPAPPGPPCAEWGTGNQEGVCLKVATSLPSGNISTNPGEFIVRIFTIILGLAGGIALLLFLSAGYKIIMSNGKPEGIQQGREQLISAIIGLVFIIFSFVIFQLVAVDILKIPGIK